MTKINPKMWTLFMPVYHIPYHQDYDFTWNVKPKYSMLFESCPANTQRFHNIAGKFR